MIFLLVSFDRNLKLGLWKHIKVFDTACNLTTNLTLVCHSAEHKKDMSMESFSLDNPKIFR